MAAMIKAGMKLTCENGHEIATAAVDMDEGDCVTVKSFTDWKIKPPSDGDKIGPCPICGAGYIGGPVPAMVKGHFKDAGWLP